MSTFSFTSYDIPQPVGNNVYISVDGVNAAGEAVGNYGFVDGDGDGEFLGFTGAGGVTTMFNPPGSTNTDVVGITASGEIFGDYTDQFNRHHGFTTVNGVTTPFDIISATATYIFGINNSGVMWGDFVSDGSFVSAFVDNNGVFSGVNVSGAASTSVAGVDAAGDVAGTITDTSFVPHGFVIINGVEATFDPAGSINTSVVGMSADGRAFGVFEDASTNQHSFIYDHGAITTVDVPGAMTTALNGVNDAGDFAGYYLDASGNVHGFFDVNGVLTTLDVPGATQTNIQDITDAGVIYGYYDDSHYQQHGFVGTPASVGAVAGSFDGAPFGDVLFQNNGTGQLVFASMNAGQFAGWGLASSPIGTIAAFGYGDVNGDGFADIFAQDPTTNAILVAEQHGTGTPTWLSPLGELTSDYKLVGVGDIAGDGSADALVQQQSNGAIYYANLANGALANWGVVSTGLGSSDWKASGVGDINGDGFADVVVQQQSTGLTLYADMDHGQFSGWQAVGPNLGTDWKVVGVGDINGDGFADVIFQDQTHTGTAIYADMHGGTFNGFGVVAQGLDTTWVASAVSDVDNDSHADVIFQRTTDGLTLYAHEGTNGFLNWGAVTAEIGPSWHVV